MLLSRIGFPNLLLFIVFYLFWYLLAVLASRIFFSSVTASFSAPACILSTSASSVSSFTPLVFGWILHLISVLVSDFCSRKRRFSAL